MRHWLRLIKYSLLHEIAKYKAAPWIPNIFTQELLFPIFLIGCGRSGTTILGKILSEHPNISYLFEPYHLWAAVDPRTDILNLYSRIDADLMMNESHYSWESQMRFNRLFLYGNKNQGILLEKTPLNAMRIGYINALAPEAKFIHIVRDGIDVSLSIARLASTNTYKIAGKPQFNQWWGVQNYKWTALSRDGGAAGYNPDEIKQLEDNQGKGAYEWLVTLGEIERWREFLGNRLYEITYNQLTGNPEETLRNICQFLQVDISSSWIKKAAKTIYPARSTLGNTLQLPSGMCASFNLYQTRFNFPNRAIPL